MVKPAVRHYSEFRRETTYGGTSLIHQLAKGSTLQSVGVDHVEVKPNSELKPHFHNSPSVLILILQGRGTVHLNGTRHLVKKGDVLHIPPRTSHGFKTSKAKLVFLSVQTPAIYGKAARKDTHFL